MRKRPFKFYDMWASHESFLDIVKEVWNKKVEGTKMYGLVAKMKMLKMPLKKLNKLHYDKIEMKFFDLQGKLHDIQEQLHSNPSCS